jgi:hypothetical protein
LPGPVVAYLSRRGGRELPSSPPRRSAAGRYPHLRPSTVCIVAGLGLIAQLLLRPQTVCIVAGLP